MRLDYLSSQSTGQVTHVDSNGNSNNVGTGYAGHGDGLNNPNMQYVQGVGPLSQGAYTIGKQQNNRTGYGHMERLLPTLVSPPVSKLFLGKLELELEQTTLIEITRAVGVGEVHHRGDAGNSEYSLCYTASSGGRSARIWISSGELGGAAQVIDKFYVEAIKPAIKISPSCPTLPMQFRELSLKNSLRLGSTPGQLQVLFGKPSAKMDNWWFYSYSGVVPANGFDQVAILGVHIDHGRIIGLFMSQTSTN